ncbi:MAG: DNA internalization-related competence protein ComEC/Rec2 [Neisseriaceae bacterium]|nr:DNA internalization-related competence protein ComEC/Rec2 [Neisseriaceae bacterium]
MKRLPIFLLFFPVGIMLSFALPTAKIMAFLMIAIIFLLLTFIQYKKLFLLFTICFSLCLGIAYGFWRTEINISHRLSAQQPNKIQTFHITVISQPEQLEKYVRFYAQLTDNHIKRRVLLSDYHNRKWQKGEVWQIKTRLISPVGNVNSSGFNREIYALTNQIDAFGNIYKDRKLIKQNQIIKQTEIRNYINQRIMRVGKNYPQGASLISALTIGKTEHLTPNQWQNLRHLGIVHLVSISGLHIGTVAGTVALLLFYLLKIIAKKYHFLPTRSPKILITIIALTFATIYAFLAGFSIPTQRSLMMIAILAFSLITYQYFTLIKIWQIALFLILLFDPTAVLTVGFYLSFGLTLAIIFYLNNRIVQQKNHKIILFIKTQYAAVIASIVPLSLFFAYFPIISPIANSIFVPFFSLILVPFSLLSLIIPFDFPLLFIIYIAELTMKLVNFMAQFSPILPISKSPILLIILSFIATIILLLPRGLYLHLWAVIVLLIFIFFPTKRLPENYFQATIYDVGQGLSVLIKTQNHSLLFDTGKAFNANNLTQSLYADGIRHLDILVLSHNDDDHDGGRNEIQAAFKPKQIIAGENTAYSFTTQHCTGNTTQQLDGVIFEWLTPTNADDMLDGNDKSCVLRVIANSQALLITGDLSQKYEQQLVEKYGNDLYSQALILGHHGSKTSSSSTFLDAVRPDIAIASAGFANAYHHPHPSVLKRLNQRNIAVYRTDYQGALRLNTVSGSLKVEQVKSYRTHWQQKPIF